MKGRECDGCRRNPEIRGTCTESDTVRRWSGTLLIIGMRARVSGRKGGLGLELIMFRGKVELMADWRASDMSERVGMLPKG